MRWFLALLAVLAAFPAAAEPLDWFGYDSRAISTGGGAGGVALSKSAGALYANPALLVRAPTSIGWEYVMYHPKITIRPFDGGDTVLSRPHNSILMCMVSDFGIEGFRLSTILKTPVPTLASMRFRYFDEREHGFSDKLHMVRFGEWDDMIFLHTGAAYQPWRWFSFGVSLKTNFMLRSRTTTSVAGSAISDASIGNGGVDFEVRFRPAVGLGFRPLDWLHLGITYRMESRLEGEFETRTALLDEDGEAEVITRKDAMTTLFQPHELALGVGVEMDGWFVEASGTWARWSEFRTVQRTRPEDDAAYADMDLPGAPVVDRDRFRFHDTAKVALGAGWAWLPWAEALLGLAFHQSPVPEQVGRTNFVDGQVLGLTAGHRFRFKLFETRMEAGLYLQAWHLFEETVRKDPALIWDEDPADAALQTNNPGYPGYSVEGWTWVTGASLKLEI